MPHPLAVLRDRLLEKPNMAELLRLADNYLASMDKMGNNFVLPSEHEIIKPILDYYTGDLAGWVKYVKNIRDHAGKDSASRAELQDIYRTVEIRDKQRVRRERLNAAVTEALRQGIIENTVPSKERYEKRCTQAWMRERTIRLDGARYATSSGKLTQAERNAILKEFWDEVDQQIAIGDIPQP